MHVEFATSGGFAYFPGLARPVVIEASQLPEEEARQLEDLVAASHFFDLPEPTASTLCPSSPDCRQHTITIEKGGRCHTLIINEPIEDSGIKQLVSFLEAQVKAARAKARAAAPGKE
jgi:hypothetical protein